MENKKIAQDWSKKLDVAEKADIKFRFADYAQSAYSHQSSPLIPNQIDPL